jgi:hypothetical protein
MYMMVSELIFAQYLAHIETIKIIHEKFPNIIRLTF